MEKPPQAVPVTVWLFVAFYILLRLKTFLDDHHYFGTAEKRSWHFKLGFIFAVVSWLAWALGGYMLGQLNNAYFALGVALTVSTIWIVADALRAGPYREQYYWIATNAIYIILLWALYKRDQPVGDWVSWSILSVLIVLVLVDLILSRSFKHLEEE
ncbi:hypothetical protein [Thiohalobacter sp. COW1]|uniref:hypothetical protein n=1 Tax=Thiohalobacter sp. COW1 TaxID=2795687 RepID=UPI001915DAAC|nr:hypothetical protein [Thiohalobacter sp. COW1]